MGKNHWRTKRSWPQIEIIDDSDRQSIRIVPATGLCRRRSRRRFPDYQQHVDHGRSDRLFHADRGRVTAPLAQVASLITRYYQARAAVQGVDDIMKLPVERTPGKNYIHRPVIRGDIEFRNVTFAYPDQSIPALKNVSFKISQGERVGIIGRIGSGKSTLEKLILGIYEPNEGSVWVDGVDLQQIDPGRPAPETSVTSLRT